MSTTFESAEKTPSQSVQVFGKKKKAVALAFCSVGTGIIRVNNKPIELISPAIMKAKALEPVLLLGAEKFSGLDLKIKVSGGGSIAQIYAVRQSIARAIVAFYQKYVDEVSKQEIKNIFVQYDRSILVTDCRKAEPKVFGGRGSRSRYQKSYR